MSTPLAAPASVGALPQPPAFDAEAIDPLGQTVRQLLLDALARARQLPAPAPAAVPIALSTRECDVLQRIAAGDSNKAIARALGLSPHTVKRHVANILAKLDLATRGQAAAWWVARQPRPPVQ